MANSKTIIYKSVGQNVKLIIEGEAFNKKIVDAEERKLIKERVISYNAKPLVKEKKALISLMNQAKVEAKKEKAPSKKQVVSKKVKEVIEKEPELTKEEQIKAAKKLLEENNYSVNVKQGTKSYQRYRGEY